MASAESERTARLYRDVVEPLSYYNERARAEELAKYTAAELRRAVAEDEHAVLLARHHDAIAGFCISRYDDGLIWLSWFGVADAYRRKGVGTILLRSLADTLGARRAHKVWCDTRTDNITSQQLLGRTGFRRLVELRNHWYGQDFTLWEWYPQ